MPDSPDRQKPLSIEEIKALGKNKPTRHANQSVMFPTGVKSRRDGYYSQDDDEAYDSDDTVPNGAVIGARIK